jgi:ABC transporter substrate binding protein
MLFRAPMFRFVRAAAVLRTRWPTAAAGSQAAQFAGGSRSELQHPSAPSHGRPKPRSRRWSAGRRRGAGAARQPAGHQPGAEAATKHRMLAMGPFRNFTDDGSLVSYGLNSAELYRQAASYVDRILKGEHPAELPIQAPTKFDLIINVTAAKTIGLEVRRCCSPAPTRSSSRCHVEIGRNRNDRFPDGIGGTLPFAGHLPSRSIPPRLSRSEPAGMCQERTRGRVDLSAVRAAKALP